MGYAVRGQRPLFNTDEDLLGTRAAAAASAFRGIRVFCLVFILCVYPCHHQITIHPTAEDRKRLRSTYRLNDRKETSRNESKKEKETEKNRTNERKKKIAKWNEKTEKEQKKERIEREKKEKKSAHGENARETRFFIVSRSIGLIKFSARV